jgi:plastocyanin
MAADAATNVVKMGNYWFSPTNIAINLGDSVLWTNTSLTAHDATSTTWATPISVPRQLRFQVYECRLLSSRSHVQCLGRMGPWADLRLNLAP